MCNVITAETVEHPYSSEFTITRTRVELWQDDYPVPVGTMWMMPCPFGDNGMWIEYIEVLATHRRLGVATRLIEWARAKYGRVDMCDATEEGAAFIQAIE